MKTYSRYTIEKFISDKFSLGQIWKFGFDSTCWFKDNKVIKVSLLDNRAIEAHNEFLNEGENFPYIAPILGFEIVGKSDLYSKSTEWFFCLITQKFIKDEKTQFPPVKWIFKNTTWYQYDTNSGNAVSGLWVDTVRIKKLKS